ncbi:MAG TPA: ABC transporter substrate-binding protein [Casimicrobiaceae bacterium]|nr:ABC transporter substrate-binding protein [Casimicrobiaceae bacterium]
MHAIRSPQRRRRLGQLAAIAALVAGGAPAQRPAPIVVGVLRATPSGARDATQRLVAALKRRGFDEGRNLVVDARYADGRLERLPALARDLVARKPDVMVVVGAAAAQAARQATSTLPIVFFGNFDPLRLGLVQSLAKPGGNCTGVLIAAQGTLAAKRLELLREAVPSAERIGVLAPDDPNFATQRDELRHAADRMGIALTVAAVTHGDYERAFAALVAAKVQALFVGAHTFFARDAERIVALANRHRLPASYEWPEHAELGGFMGYGADLDELYDRVALQVDRILRGAPPGDLPVEQPTKVELVVNTRTAAALGVTLPASLAARVDRRVP